mgnify:CR=1 FL=1
MFSTTRRALGVLGLTTSLVASLQIPGLVSEPVRPPEVVSLSTTFRIPAESGWGALSCETTPVPVQCSYASFTVPCLQPKATKKDKQPTEAEPFLNPRCADITEEIVAPHPLELADAEEIPSTNPVVSFQLETIPVKKGQTLAQVAGDRGLEAAILRNLNGGKVDTPFAKETSVTIYKGRLKPYTVKSGDSIWSISRCFRMKMSVLIYLNGLRTTKIFPGKKIFLPAGTIENQSMSLMAAVPWVRKMLEPAYHTLLAKYGRLTSGFGWRKHPVTKRRGFHVGIDIAAPTGTVIKAWKSGKVERAGTLGLMGKCVIIRHPGGFVSVYGHCDKVLVKAGDKVRLGQKIAKVGKTGRATGTHLHFAIKRGGHWVNPLKYLGS